MIESTSHPFDTLSPDMILDAVESQGFICNGRLLALNSYENRVYQVGLEEESPVIAKFYRPARWSDAQILEEHQFCFELQEAELPVVSPWVNSDGGSLFSHGGFRFSVYPRRGGHPPELDSLDNLFTIGRLLGRIHRVGAVRDFVERPHLDAATFGVASARLIADSFIPDELAEAYRSLTRDVLGKINDIIDKYGELHCIRVHGDCHAGNMLWRDDNPHFVDFDDARMAPAIQDLWMLLSGSRFEQTRQIAEIVDGYGEFCDFDVRQLRLVEVLRTLRIMHHSAWLAERWHDPAFPRAFPWFNTVRYWSEHILELREQFAALDEPSLPLGN